MSAEVYKQPWRTLFGRLIALGIDCLLFTPLWLLANEIAAEHGGGSVGSLGQYIKDVCFQATFFLYFFLTDWLCGGTVGKRLLRLRVVRANGSGAAGPWRILARTAVFSLTLFLLPNLLEFLTASDRGWVLWTTLGIASVVMFMHPQNNFRGLHEWLSGTAVLPASERRPLLTRA